MTPPRIRPPTVLLSGVPVKSLALIGHELWAGTTNGIERFRVSDTPRLTFQRQRRIGREQGMPGHFISEIVESAGRIWVGTEAGLAELDTSGAVRQIFQKHHGLADNLVTALSCRGSHVYIGTRGWGITRLDLSSGVFEYTVFGKSRDANEITGFAASPSDFVATTRADVRRYNPLTDRWEVIPFMEGRALPAFTSAAIEGNDLWLGTGERGLFRYNLEDRHWEHYSTLEGLTEDDVRHVTVNGLDVIAATADGISVFDAQTKIFERIYLTPERSRSETINRILATPWGWMAGTELQGLQFISESPRRRPLLAFGSDVAFDSAGVYRVPFTSAEPILHTAVRLPGRETWDSSAARVEGRTLVWESRKSPFGHALVKAVSARNTGHLRLIADNRKPELSRMDRPGFVSRPDVILKGRLQDDALSRLSVSAGTVRKFDPVSGKFEISLTLSSETQDIVLTAEDRFFNTSLFHERIIYDSIPPRLALDAVPARLSEPVLRLAGKILDRHPDTVLFDPAPRSLAGSAHLFVAEFLLNDGPNLISVTARDRAGQTDRQEINVHHAPLSGMLDSRRTGPRSTSEGIFRSILAEFQRLGKADRQPHPLNLYVEMPVGESEPLSAFSKRCYGDARFQDLLVQINRLDSPTVPAGRTLIVPIQFFPVPPVFRPVPVDQFKVADLRELPASPGSPQGKDGAGAPVEDVLATARKWMDDVFPSSQDHPLYALAGRMEALHHSAKSSYVAGDTNTAARALNLLNHYSLLYQSVYQEVLEETLASVNARIIHDTTPAKIRMIYRLARRAMEYGNYRDAGTLMPELRGWLNDSSRR